MTARTVLVNPWADEESIPLGICDYGGCRRPSQWIVSFGAEYPEGPATVERRPLCTRHADESSAAWHVMRAHGFEYPTLTHRFAVPALVVTR